MTSKRRELLEAWVSHDTISNAAKVIGISEEAAKSRLFAMRLAYSENKRDCVEFERYKLKLERL